MEENKLDDKNLLKDENYKYIEKIYNQKTIFDILGVSRQENPHSSFIRWLLDPNAEHGLGDVALKALITSICKRYKVCKTYLKEDNKTYKAYSGKLQENAENKHLFFNTDTYSDKKTYIEMLCDENYEISGTVSLEREKRMKKNRRADIFIEIPIKQNQNEEKLLLFIENKIRSHENDGQTNKYMEEMLEGKGKYKDYKYIIPLYFYPAKNIEIKEAIQNNAIPCDNQLFLLYNYQYFLDDVLVKCKAKAHKTNNTKIKELISDYIVTLESPKGEDSAGQGYIVAVEQKLQKKVKKLVEKNWDYFKKEIDSFIESTGNGNIRIDKGILETYYISETNNLDPNDVNDEKLKYIKEKLLNENRAVYYGKINGNVVEFKSGNRAPHSLGSLAYMLIRQYIKDKKITTVDEVRKAIGISGGTNNYGAWLGGVILDLEEAKSFVKAWSNAKKSEENSVCAKYNFQDEKNSTHSYEYDKKSDKWILNCCPLAEAGYNPLKPTYKNEKTHKNSFDGWIKLNKNGKENISEIIEKLENESSCVMPIDGKCLNNKGLYNLYYGVEKAKTERLRGNKLRCFYDFVHSYYVKDFKKLMEKEGYSDIKMPSEEGLKLGVNEVLPAIKLGEDNYVFIGRYWFDADIKELVNKLGKDKESTDYISLSSSGIKKEFTAVDGVKF